MYENMCKEISKYFNKKNGTNYEFLMLYSTVPIRYTRYYLVLTFDQNGQFKNVMRCEEKEINYDVHIPILINSNIKQDHYGVNKDISFDINPIELGDAYDFDYETVFSSDELIKTLVKFLSSKNKNIDDVYNYSSKEFFSNERFMEILKENIIKLIPNDAIFINNDMLKEFANNKGYDSACLKAKDEGAEKPPIAYCGPEWNFDYELIKNPIIDFDNFPANIPDKQTCENLEKLFKEGKLKHRVVKYKTMPDFFEEYDFDGRKFVRYLAAHSQDDILLSDGSAIVENKNYWIEVKPISDILELQQEEKRIK